MSSDAVDYQISQTFDFFEEEVGLETTVRRPIVNTRDEPHCDARISAPARNRRCQHVRSGNLPQSGEHGNAAFGRRRQSNPEMPALANLLSDHPSELPSLLPRHSSIRWHDNSSDRVQWQLFDIARTWFEQTGGEAVGESDCALALEHWERILTGLEHNPTVADSVDWIAKHRLISAHAERHQLKPGAAASVRSIAASRHETRERSCKSMRSHNPRNR